MFRKKTKMATSSRIERNLQNLLKLVGKMIYLFNSIKLRNCRVQQLGMGNLHSCGKNWSQDFKAISVSAINQSDCEFKQ